MDPMARIYQGFIEVIHRELKHLVDNLLKDAFNLSMFTNFMKSIGIDMSQLPGMVGKQPGFDPYQVLGLDKSASDDEVKKRYRALLSKLHPDTAGVEGTTFLLQMVLAAYELIKRERRWQ